jgi:LEA14-like dessication related protein
MIFMIFHVSKVMSSINHKRSTVVVLLVGASILLGSCLPKDTVELKDILNLQLVPAGLTGDPVLQGDAVFYNPNKSRMKLKSIKVDVYVDDKKSAVVDHDLNILVKGRSEFTVPLKVQIQMKDIGLMDALKSLLGGKTYQLHYVGTLKVNLNGLPFRVPIDHREEFKIKL